MSKRMWLLTLALSFLAVLAAVAWRCWPRTVPLSQCSEVYQRYHDIPGIQASFIKNKQIRLCHPAESMGPVGRVYTRHTGVDSRRKHTLYQTNTQRTPGTACRQK